MAAHTGSGVRVDADQLHEHTTSISDIYEAMQQKNMKNDKMMELLYTQDKSVVTGHLNEVKKLLQDIYPQYYEEHFEGFIRRIERVDDTEMIRALALVAVYMEDVVRDYYLHSNYATLVRKFPQAKKDLAKVHPQCFEEFFNSALTPACIDLQKGEQYGNNAYTKFVCDMRSMYSNLYTVD